MAQLPCTANDRPEDPPSIKKVEVLNAYFTDIVPRVTAASRRAAAEAAAAAQTLKKKKKRSVKAVKNFKLMSFGDEAEEEEISTIEAKAKVGKIVSSHDAGVDAKLSSKAGSTLTPEEAATAAKAAVAKDRAATKRKAAVALTAASSSKNNGGLATGGSDDDDDGGYGEMTDTAFNAKMKAKMARKRARKEADSSGGGRNAAAARGVTSVPDGASAPKYQFTSTADKIAAANEEARKLMEEIKAPGSTKSAGEVASAANPRSKAQIVLDEQAHAYVVANAALKGTSKKKRQDDTLAMLGLFTSQLKSSVTSDGGGDGDGDGDGDDNGDDNSAVAAEKGGGNEKVVAIEEEEYDADWMSGALKDPDHDRFDTEGIDPEHDPNTLTLEDPRNPMNQRRREKDDKRGRKKINRAGGTGEAGGRHRGGSDRDSNRWRNR